VGSRKDSKAGWKRVLIASDLHGCYLDKRAYSVFLQVAASFEWDLCILNGDVLDFSQLSSHDKKIGGFQREFADEFTLEEEIAFTKEEIFKPLRKALDKSKILMRLGNHETRYLSIAESNSQALVNLLKTMKKNKSLYLEDVLSLDKFGIDLSYNGEDTFGSFTVIHGVKTSKGAAKANLMTYGSGTSGHTHRMNAYTENMRGKISGWWESGCLRKVKNVEYLPLGARPDWSQGYLELHLAPDGRFWCQPHFIVEYETIHDGQRFSA
jgi:predicted phosphodiesterase